ncbi:uncharacterized protein EMH_0096340 [Eimeria mitis]|uniref:LisH domain-containing protein n=1 Tax=Eimeria mitis TaxID=44415 RepID=U6KC12_9EIME|nr:uncharacterized protein EMH_0096340 [Eimeria mitis]CDJ33782.1 hypothetical protein, conserved [Eimeria mitis]
MDRAPSNAALSGSSEIKFSSTASAAETSSRLLSFLSQSQLRQQLECQVRYFLSGKLLNCPGDEGAFYEPASLEQYGEDQQASRKTLAFKATLSLVLLWLKAHGLVHTAGVLCPEADMRTSDVLSQEECQAVLQLPKALLKRPLTPCVSTGLQWNLLDRLIDAVSQHGAAQASSLPSTDGVSAAERRASSASKTRCSSSDEATSSPGRSDRTENLHRAKRVKGTSCPPRSARKQKLEPAVSGSDSPRYSSSGVEASRWNEWREMAQNKMLLLEAHLKGLELRESSKRLVAANEESRNMLDQRIATLESTYEKRMRQLEKAVDQATGRQGTEAQDTTTLDHPISMLEARSKLEARLARQKDMEALLVEREAKLSERERLLDDREKELLRTALRIEKYDSRIEQNETNMMLTQENASFRSQLLQARMQVKALEAQLQRQANECVSECANCMQPTNINEAKNNEEVSTGAKQLPVGTPPVAQRGGSSEQTSTVALKKEYEGHVARLTDEIQRSNDQLRNKDAEFKLLVVELESARRKNAEAQKRLKKMQKLYEAARATCVQHRKLASSMSLSLSCMDLAVEPPPDFAEREARDLLGSENVAPNARELSYNAGSRAGLLMNGQPQIQGYGIRGDDSRWSSWDDLNSGAPRKDVHEQHLWNAANDLQKQSHKPQSFQTAEEFVDSVRPNFQRCSLFTLERQAFSSSFRTLSSRLEGQAQQLSETSDAVNRALSISTPPVGSGLGGPDASESLKCSRVSLERNSRAFSLHLSGEAGDLNSRVLREEVSKEIVGASRSSAPLLFTETANEAPPVRETSSAGLDLHSVPLKQEGSASLPNESTKAFEQGGDADHFTERRQEPELNLCNKAFCSNTLKAEPKSPSDVGLDSAGNENIEQSSAKQLLVSLGQGETLIASNASLNGHDVATARSPPGVTPSGVSSTDPAAATIESKTSVERHIKPQVEVEGSAHEGPSEIIEHHSTLNAMEASSARNVQEVTVSAPLRPPRGNANGGTEPSASTPQGSYEGEIPCFSPVAENTPPEPSPLVMQRENEGYTGSRAESPWAEASISSSLPASPQDLSNFPSLSCPVAATIEGIPSPARSRFDSRGGWTAERRKPPFNSSISASSSPSEHEWLACVSPTDPVIHRNTTDSHHEA